jgi:hypothetical protein
MGFSTSDIFARQPELLEHRVQCSRLEFVSGIADNGSPFAQNQNAVAAFAEIRAPFEP